MSQLLAISGLDTTATATAQVATFKKHGKFVAFEDILNESLWLHTIQARKHGLT